MAWRRSTGRASPCPAIDSARVAPTSASDERRAGVVTAAWPPAVPITPGATWNDARHVVAKPSRAAVGSTRTGSSRPMSSTEAPNATHCMRSLVVEIDIGQVGFAVQAPEQVGGGGTVDVERADERVGVVAGEAPTLSITTQ